MWTMLLDRSELSAATVEESPTPTPGDGQALLRVDRVGVTANNVTYAVLGESFRYWEFFPVEDAGGSGLGVVPLWGFADVVESSVAGVEVGARYFGYWPSASHLLVTPGKVSSIGFKEASPHRSVLPSPYNSYVTTTGDPSYEADTEDLVILYRPLFYTSWMLADRLVDTQFRGAGGVATTLVLSSASSKTAYAAAFCLRGAGVRLVGLTSARNLEFTRSLELYDEVLAYDDIDRLTLEPTGYLDFAGSDQLRGTVRAQLADALVLDLTVGGTHQEASSLGGLDGPRPTVFFAPDQMAKRVGDWGRDGLDRRYAEQWRGFVPFARTAVDVTVSHGPQELRRVWLEVLGGTSAPREGNIVALGG